MKKTNISAQATTESTSIISSTPIKSKGRESTIRKKYAYMELPVFECDKGWHKLLDTLCEAIAKVDKQKSVRVEQIKEKYGTLRFYIPYKSGTVAEFTITKRIFKIISRFEKISAKTCEVCGNKGHLRVLAGHYWYKTLCDRHAKKLGYVNIKVNKILIRFEKEKKDIEAFAIKTIKEETKKRINSYVPKKECN